jgi:hypothetical protein
LQQACEYLGPGAERGRPSTGRTFPIDHATIGLAYACRRIVRSTNDVSPDALQTAMAHLKLNVAASKMAAGVRFLLAIPILQPDNDFFLPSPVAGVLYIDSGSPEFWLSDSDVASLCAVLGHALDGVHEVPDRVFDRLRNIRLTEISQAPSPPVDLPMEVSNALELVGGVWPPATDAAFQFNFEHSDLTPISLAAKLDTKSDGAIV